ncbi:MAG: LLM class F420-dependent oxidoreductase [Ilumatobacteraceae bacterium]
MTHTRPIRIAAQLHPQHGTWAALGSAVDRSEDLGYDAAYNWDHFFPLYGDPDGSHFEAFTTLAAWAERTSSITLGTLVTCAAYRNANLVADSIRTIDHIAGGGRTVFGVGAGWFERDFDDYGYKYATTGERAAQLAKSIRVVRHRWQILNPSPVQPVPVMVGGVGERLTLRIVAEQADIWHAMFPAHAADLHGPIAALGRHCADVGRSPDDLEWAVGVEPDDLDRFLSVEAPVLLAAGFTQFTLGFNGPDWDVSAGRDWLLWRDHMNEQRCS